MSRSIGLGSQTTSSLALLGSNNKPTEVDAGEDCQDRTHSIPGWAVAEAKEFNESSEGGNPFLVRTDERRDNAPSLSETQPANLNTNQVLLVLAGLFPEAILEVCLVPLYPFILRRIAPNKSEGEIGYYTGLLVSAFYAPLFVMNVIWGSESDRGRGRRKLFLLLGLGFGMLTSLWTAYAPSIPSLLFSRFLGGIFGANSTIAKAAIGVLLSDEISRSSGYSWYGMVFGLSGIIGPMLAGSVNVPSAESKQNSTLSDVSLGTSSDSPFTAPILVCTFMYAVCFMASVRYLSASTLDSKHPKDPNLHLYTELSDSSLLESAPSPSLTDLASEDSTKTPLPFGLERTLPDKVVFIIRQIRSLPIPTKRRIGFYCLVACTNMVFLTYIPMYLSSPEGGLGLASAETAYLITIVSLSKFLTQFFLTTELLARYKAALCYYAGMSLLVLLNVLLPVVSSQYALLIIFLVLFGFCDALAYLSILLLITMSTPPEKLGLAHGLASTCAAIVRTISPILTGCIWEMGTRSSFGTYGVFLLGASSALLGCVLYPFIH